MDETAKIVNRRKQLQYRANHRGIKEMDIIFGRFADRFINGFEAGDLDRFEALMAYNDRDLLQWFTGELPLREDVDAELFNQVLAFANKKLQQGH